MIKANLFKMQASGWKYDNPTCRHLPEYHDNIIGSNFFIKQETTCLSFVLGFQREVYCRDCIDLIYQDLKPILDSRLWSFI